MSNAESEERAANGREAPAEETPAVKAVGAGGRARVPLCELVDLDRLAPPGRPVSPRRLREALPPGWIPDADGIHAVRDSRVFFRESWILLSGLIVFGGIGGAFLIGAMPRGSAGWLRLGVLVGVLLLLGGVAGPLITKGLLRR